MRKRAPKFALKFEGAEIQTMAELRDKFDLKACIKYLEDDQLARWLADRLYDDEAEKIRALDVQDKNLARELCKIFSVDYDTVSEQLDDAETIAWRKERRERLKKFTSNTEILKRVDDVAFDQDDLIDILRDENIPGTIYLCGGNFVFPSGALKRQNITYVGVGENVNVKIDTQKPVDIDDFGIRFQNLIVDGVKKNDIVFEFSGAVDEIIFGFSGAGFNSGD